MKLRNIVGAVALGSLVGLAGCENVEKYIDHKIKESVPESVEVPEITLTGLPLGVLYTKSHSSHDLRIALRVEEGKPARVVNSFDYQSDLAHVAALIDAEINDGDSEGIRVTGYPQGEDFRMRTIAIEGKTYEIGWREYVEVPKN